MYYSWLIILASLAPSPSRVEHETVSVGVTTQLGLLYTNPAQKSLEFEISTSRPDLLVPKYERVTIGKGQARKIEFKALSIDSKQTGMATIFVFIADIEQYVMECIELRLTYV